LIFTHKRLILEKYHSPKSFFKKYSNIYKLRNTKKASPLLYVAIILFLSSIVVLSTFYFWNNYILDKQAQQFYELLPIEEQYTESRTQDIITYTVDHYSSIRAAWVNIVPEEHYQMSNEVYQYTYSPNAISPTLQEDTTKNRFYDIVYFSFSSSLPNSEMMIDAKIAQIQLNHIILYIGVLLFINYWFVFAYWALKNLHYTHQNRLTITAIIYVLLFNLIGYLVYKHFNKEKICCLSNKEKIILG